MRACKYCNKDISERHFRAEYCSDHCKVANKSFDPVVVERKKESKKRYYDQYLKSKRIGIYG